MTAVLLWTQTEAALIYDAVHVLAHALERVLPSFSRMRLVNLSCDGDQAWAFGSSLYSYLNLVSNMHFCVNTAIRCFPRILKGQKIDARLQIYK